MRHAQSPPPARRSLRRRAIAVVAVPMLCGACASPNALAELQGQLDQAADAVNDIRVNLSIMQGTIDSLTMVVAKQDTTIARLANATGVQIVK